MLLQINAPIRRRDNRIFFRLALVLSCVQQTASAGKSYMFWNRFWKKIKVADDRTHIKQGVARPVLSDFNVHVLVIVDIW